MQKIIFLFFSLWLFKVEAQTPVLVKTFNTNSNVSFYLRESNASHTIQMDGILFFAGYDNTNGYQVWRSDGTERGTYLLKQTSNNNNPNSYEFFLEANGLFYFRADKELWQSDGTENGTKRIDFSGSDPFNFQNINGTIFFQTSITYQTLQLWKISLSPLLPVQLLTFTAKLTNNKVQLDWKTATELNTLGFDIERSVDGQTFSKVGFIGAKNQPSEYQYFDQSPKLNEVNYYRLCTIDIDSKKEFSKIVSVKMNEVRSPIKIYPSVTDGIIQIETTLGIDQVWVSNISGQILLTSTQTSFNIGSFPTGIYLVTVKGVGVIFSETVFKK